MAIKIRTVDGEEFEIDENIIHHFNAIETMGIWRMGKM